MKALMSGRDRTRRALCGLSDDEAGQDLIEYSLLTALLAVACITSILEITRIVKFFEAVGTLLQNAI